MNTVPSLNSKTYKTLCNKTDVTDIDAWYDKTYPLFQKGKFKLGNHEDFLILVSLAYSWMPTVPVYHDSGNWEEASQYLKHLPEQEALRKFMELVVPMINNSIVGVSKALHFAYPNDISIIDSNVVKGWRKLFYKTETEGYKDPAISPLPINFGSFNGRKSTMSRHIDYYLRYCNNLNEWTKNLDNDVTPRDIETRLYLLGKEL